jgi:hypothetical protein
MPSARLAGIAAAALLLAYSAFQMALALGAPWGHLAWGGRHRTLPTGWRIASACSAVVMLLLVAVALRASGVVGGAGPTGHRRFVLALAITFAVGVVMNLASRSPWEKLHALPAALLALSFLAMWRDTGG